MKLKKDFSNEQVIDVATANGVCVVRAKLFKMPSIDEIFALHEDKDNFDLIDTFYSVSEISIGMSVVSGEKTKAKARAKAEIRFKSNAVHWEHVKRNAIGTLKEKGIKYPVNTMI